MNIYYCFFNKPVYSCKDTTGKSGDEDGFLYGRKFIVVTDHKPLVTLFAPDKGTPAMAANRLARWALLVHQYDYTVEYRRSKSK